MALTPEEQGRLDSYEKRLSQPAASQGLTPEEQSRLDGYEQRVSSEPKYSSFEAKLGPILRGKYVLESIESNREALLKQSFGEENVQRDQNGNLFVKQDGSFRPVNAPGFGLTDVAELAGALPETVPEAIGAAVGGAGGFAAGAPAGPAALGTGAMGLAAGRSIGGGLGSVFRQALSTAAGTPQVATIGERAQEVGLSALTAPIGGAVSDIATPYLKQIPGVKRFFGSTQKEAASSISQAIDPELRPIATEAIEDVSTPREIVGQELTRLKDIASRQGLPEPTYAQAAGGKAILAESKIIDTPLIGGKVRKQVDEQVKSVRKNLEKIAGNFINADSTAYEVGLATRELAEKNKEVQKQVATELYDKVSELGADAAIGKRTFFNKYRDFSGKLGLINPDLTPAKYAADVGLTRDEFKILQGAMFDGIDAIKRTKSPKIKFESVNALRKTLNATAEEMRDKNPNAARILSDFVRDINSTAENVLSREAPKLGEVFREANKNYAKFKQMEEFNKKIFSEGIGDEKVVKKLMSDSAKISSMKEVIGEDKVKEVGTSFIRDILEPLSKSGVARADTALSAIKKNAAQIKAAIGEEEYKNLTENLYYLNRVNQPLNVSRTSLYNLFNETTGGVKGLALRTAGAAKTYSEATGKSLTKPITEPVKKGYQQTAGKFIRKGSIGNVLTTQEQTEASR